MKKVLIILFILFSYSAFSQYNPIQKENLTNTDSLTNSTVFFKFSLIKDQKIKLNLPKKINYFAVFRPAINAYQFYPSPNKIAVDLNASHAYLFRSDKIKLDSFNPHGANNMEEALAFGILNTIFEKLFE